MTPTGIVCLFAVVVAMAAGWASAPQARADTPTVAAPPAAFLGIGDENEPDENEPDEGGQESASRGSGSSTPLPLKLLLVALGVAAVVYAVKIIRRIRSRLRRLWRVQSRRVRPRARR